jgi:hypothetical protein
VGIGGGALAFARVEVHHRFSIESGGHNMCHESWWWRHRYEERDASRELWDEFEQTRPLSDPEPADEDTEITLERSDTDPVAADR